MEIHEHKIVKILESEKVDCYYAYSIEMDCPVQPLKVVITKSKLSEGEYFDPHFSNWDVLARFPPDKIGWGRALNFVKSL